MKLFGIIMLLISQMAGAKSVDKVGCTDCFNFVAPSVLDAEAISGPDIGLVVYDIGDSRIKSFDAAGNWQNLNSASMNTKLITTSYIVDLSDQLILADASSATISLSLPSLATIPVGRKFTFKKTDASANALQFVFSGADSLSDGFLQLNTAGETVTLLSDGSNWQIVDHRIPKSYREIEITSPTQTTTGSSWLDVAGSTLTLPPGTWELGYDGSLSAQSIGGSNQVVGNITIADSANNHLNGTLREIVTGNLGNTSTFRVGTSAKTEISITSTSTYKLRIFSTLSSSSGTVRIGTREDIFWARKIR